MLLGRKLRAALICIAAVAVTGCAEPPPPPPTIVNLAVTASDDLNPNASGRASPAVVRVYYLVSATSFEEADFFQLFEQEAAILGADLTARDEITMEPGSAKTLTREPRADVRFLGVAASYRDIDSSVWRAVIAVPPNQTSALEARLDAQAIALSDAPAPAE